MMRALDEMVAAAGPQPDPSHDFTDSSWCRHCGAKPREAQAFMVCVPVELPLREAAA